ncbi:hypothetical protein ACZ90_12520 [Streptomyces albus subsp. albus]|nr:hypothetical protein ACZ90_12520 [Streptomyces albus subsp. albus]
MNSVNAMTPSLAEVPGQPTATPPGTDPQASTELDGILIEDLVEAPARLPLPGICICTVAAA